MDSYRLTRSAAADLVRIFEYGIETFGVDQAVVYYDALVGRISDLVREPFLYPAVDEIRNGYRRSICGVHAIYYRVEENGILIVRVLGQQDAHAALSGAETDT